MFDLTDRPILVLFDLISLPSIILISMQCLPLFSALFADKQQRLSPLQRLQGAIFFPNFPERVYSNQSYRHYSDYSEQFFPDFSLESLSKSKLLRLKGAFYPQLSWENSLRQKRGDEFECALKNLTENKQLLKDKKWKRTHQQEIDQAFEESEDEFPDYNTIQNLPYLDMVIHETLRYLPTGVEN